MWRYNYTPDYLCHWGVKGMKWGIRRYQNKDGSLTSLGKIRYSSNKGVQKNGSTYFIRDKNGSVISKGDLFEYDIPDFDWMLAANLDTSPSYRRKGYASRIVDEMYNDAIFKGKGVYLFVDTNNKNAISLYKKHDFSTIKTYKLNGKMYYIMAKGKANINQLKNMNFG